MSCKLYRNKGYVYYINYNVEGYYRIILHFPHLDLFVSMI